jgi:hypothetical protein
MSESNSEKELPPTTVFTPDPSHKVMTAQELRKVAQQSFLEGLISACWKLGAQPGQ